MSTSSEFQALSLSSTDLVAAGESHPMAVLQGDDRTPLLRDQQRTENRQEEEEQEQQPLSHIERDDQQAQSEKSESLRQSPAKFWAVIVSYVCILFLFACNGTVITTIYGKVAEDLHAYATAATWLNASYMIASSCTNPLIGRLATIFRPTNLFLACTALFTLGGAMTGLAPTSGVFLAGRVVTGCGAAGLWTSAQVLLVQIAPVKRRGLLVGTMNAVITCGSSLGGVIGGAFAASRYGWRPAFLIQIPITVAAAMVIYVLAPNPPAKHSSLPLSQKLAKIDYAGIFTLSCSLVLLLLAAMSSNFALCPLLAGLAFLCAFIAIEALYATLPIIPVAVLAHRPTLLGCLSTLLTMTARWTVLFYAPIWSIAVLGYHPARAGASLIPTSFGFGAGGLLVGAFSIKHGGAYYWQCLISIAAFGMTYAIFYTSRLPTSTGTYLLLLIWNGFATGSVLNYTLAHVLSSTSEPAIVAGLYSTFRGLAPSLGAGVAGGVLQRTLEQTLVASLSEHEGGKGRLSDADWDLVRRLKGSPTLVWQLEDGWKRQIGILAYETAIKRVFLLAALATVTALAMQAFTWTKSSRVEKELDGNSSIED